MNKLTYKDHKWTLTVDGVEFDSNKLLIGSIAFDPSEMPAVTILVDSIEIDDVKLNNVTKEDL